MNKEKAPEQISENKQTLFKKNIVSYTYFGCPKDFTLNENGHFYQLSQDTQTKVDENYDSKKVEKPEITNGSLLISTLKKKRGSKGRRRGSNKHFTLRIQIFFGSSVWFN